MVDRNAALILAASQWGKIDEVSALAHVRSVRLAGGAVRLLNELQDREGAHAVLRELNADGLPTEVHHQLGSLVRRFSHADQAETVLQAHEDGTLAVVTGFGPTNAPTAGTLSVMLGIVELQRQLDVPMTVVISELGAWNSRNVPWAQLEAVRDQMFAFLEVIGFDTDRGTLRSHLDFGNLARAGKIARFLGRQDFLDHRESLLELYDEQGLLGSEVGVTVDSLTPSPTSSVRWRTAHAGW
jgi:hypothetical protein